MTDHSHLLALVDHTALKPETTRDTVLQLCAEAREWEVAAVCVNSAWVPTAAEQLDGDAISEPIAYTAALAQQLVARSIEMEIIRTQF